MVEAEAKKIQAFNFQMYFGVAYPFIHLGLTIEILLNITYLYLTLIANKI